MLMNQRLTPKSDHSKAPVFMPHAAIQINTLALDSKHVARINMTPLQQCRDALAVLRDGTPTHAFGPELRAAIAAADAELSAPSQMDANNYCRVLAHLGIKDDDTDPVVAVQMIQSWEADATARADILERHLRLVLEVAETWQPSYATKMDRDTLAHARDCADRKPPGCRTTGDWR